LLFGSKKAPRVISNRHHNSSNRSFHDMRWTAAHDLVRTDVPERVAMAIRRKQPARSRADRHVAGSSARMKPGDGRESFPRSGPSHSFFGLWRHHPPLTSSATERHCARMRPIVNSRQMHWVRACIGGFLAELTVFAIVFPTRSLFGQRAFLTSILVASAVMPFIFAVWVCRRVDSGFVLHGALVGIIAVLFYLGLAWGQPQPRLYKIAHGLKVVGGMAGGVAAARRRTSTSRSL